MAAVLTLVNEVVLNRYQATKLNVDQRTGKMQPSPTQVSNTHIIRSWLDQD